MSVALLRVLLVVFLSPQKLNNLFRKSDPSICMNEKGTAKHISPLKSFHFTVHISQLQLPPNNIKRVPVNAKHNAWICVRTNEGLALCLKSVKPKQ